MLYVTTFDDINSHTANKALTTGFVADSGAFVPFRLPKYTADEIVGLKNCSFHQTIANILNMFFSAGLTEEDVELCIGRNMVKVSSMSHKLVIAELWHNLSGSFTHIEKSLYTRLSGVSDGEIPNWVRHAVRIGYLFAIYGEMLRCESILPGQTFDVSIPNDDFILPMSAWYCRAMGLPIKTIICSCDETNNLWDFLNYGTLSTTSISDALRLGLSRLIFSTAGCRAVVRFLQSFENNQAYAIDKDTLPELNRGLFCAVAGSDRAKNTINSVYRSTSYIMDPTTALCYSALQDYRAKTGESGLTLILAEQTPMDASAAICEATGLSREDLRDYIKHS